MPYGLGNHARTVPPVRSQLFSVGSAVFHSGQMTPFGHEYAPHYAPRAQPSPTTASGVARMLAVVEILRRSEGKALDNEKGLTREPRPVLEHRPRRPSRTNSAHRSASGEVVFLMAGGLAHFSASQSPYSHHFLAATGPVAFTARSTSLAYTF